MLKVFNNNVINDLQSIQATDLSSTLKIGQADIGNLILLYTPLTPRAERSSLIQSLGSKNGRRIII